MRKKIVRSIQKHREMFVYLLVGSLTTALNYAVFLPLYNLTSIPAAVSNSIAWLIAVLFSFFANKRYVFQSRDWTFGNVVSEFFKFIGCRIASGVIETGIIFACVDLLGINGNLIKILTGILVIILNYIGSKLFVFQKSSS